MRLKTFLATYLLFVLIFFTSLGAVSVYMTSSQLNMLREKSEAEFKTIAASLAKDIAVLSGRNLDFMDFEESVHDLVDGYARYYKKNNISLELENVSDAAAEPKTELFFATRGQKHFLFIYYLGLSNIIAWITHAISAKTSLGWSVFKIFCCCLPLFFP